MWLTMVMITLSLIFLPTSGSIPWVQQQSLRFSQTYIDHMVAPIWKVKAGPSGQGAFIAYDTLPVVIEYLDFDLRRPTLRVELEGGVINGFEVDPTGNTAAVHVGDQLYLVSNEGEDVFQVPLSDPFGPFGFGFSPRGDLLYVAPWFRPTTEIWDVVSTTHIRTVPIAGDWIAFSPDSSLMAIAQEYEGRIVVVSTRSENPVSVVARPSRSLEDRRRLDDVEILSIGFIGDCDIAYVYKGAVAFTNGVRTLKCGESGLPTLPEENVFETGSTTVEIIDRKVYFPQPNLNQITVYDIASGEQYDFRGWPDRISPDESYWIEFFPEKWIVHSRVDESTFDLVTDCFDCSVLIADNGNTLVFWDESTIEIWQASSD
ncbi:MAG: hypothetical protein IPM16_04765 [Chloroflexi bacterium]|nr:hypothetical protein [Chloroflexota bacterium]